jgi:hypothetical protein
MCDAWIANHVAHSLFVFVQRLWRTKMLIVAHWVMLHWYRPYQWCISGAPLVNISNDVVAVTHGWCAVDTKNRSAPNRQFSFWESNRLFSSNADPWISSPRHPARMCMLISTSSLTKRAVGIFALYASCTRSGVPRVQIKNSLDFEKFKFEKCLNCKIIQIKKKSNKKIVQIWKCSNFENIQI